MRNIYNPESGFAYKYMLPEHNHEFTALWGAKIANNLFSCRGLIGTFEIPSSVYDDYLWRTDAAVDNKWTIPLNLQQLFYYSPQVQLLSRFLSGTIKQMGMCYNVRGTVDNIPVSTQVIFTEDVSGTIAENALIINHISSFRMPEHARPERMTHIYYRIFGL